MACFLSLGKCCESVKTSSILLTKRLQIVLSRLQSRISGSIDPRIGEDAEQEYRR